MDFSTIILLSIIWTSLSSLTSPTSSSSSLLMNSTRNEIHHQINHNSSLENRSHGIAEPVSWKHTSAHKHPTLRTVHGTVNIIGWGVLLPVGAMIARYFKKLCNDWYSLHILSQFSGFLLGTLGWGLGISIKNQGSMSTHGILGTIIFAFATLQLLGMCLQADEEHKCRKYWVIYHQLTGYALIALIIANIFQGMNHQNAPKKWEYFYGAILGVLGVIAIALEVLRWRYAI